MTSTGTRITTAAASVAMLTMATASTPGTGGAAPGAVSTEARMTDPAIERAVEGRTLRSSDLPAVAVTVPEGFRFLGRFDFEIGEIATGERFVFVDAEGSAAHRMIIAQFEAMRPDTDEIYRYSFDGAPERAGYRWRSNPFFFRHSDARASNPSGEAARTEDLLADHGLEIADEVMAARFLTVPDAARRHELILFYVERVADTGHEITELHEGNEATPLWEALSAPLMERGRAALDIAPFPDRDVVR